jgi:hypothetical protein
MGSLPESYVSSFVHFVKKKAVVLVLTLFERREGNLLSLPLNAKRPKAAMRSYGCLRWDQPVRIREKCILLRSPGLPDSIGISKPKIDFWEFFGKALE